MKLLKNKKTLYIGIALVILFFLGRAIFFPPAKEQKTETVQRGDIVEQLVLSGDVDAEKKAALKFQSGGLISWVGVKEGDTVKKGQILAKLDTVQLNSVYQEALAGLRLQEAIVNRVHDDLKGKDASETFSEKQTRVTAEVAKDTAYENVIQAKKALDNASIISPIDGVVTNIEHQNPGETVSALENQIEVVNVSTIKFIAAADQSEVTFLKVGQTGTLTLDTVDGKSFPVLVTAIGITPKLNETSTAYEVQMSVANLPENTTLRVGMTGDVSFILKENKNALFISPGFIKSDNGGKYVLLENKQKQYVKTGIEGEGKIEILDGLQEGQKITQ
jgi:RND family efflux transporter MFP subunit